MVAKPRARLERARRPRRREGAWSLAIHGGAGAARPRGAEPAREQALHATLTEVLGAGARSLAAGQSSLDVVETAVRALEDSPLFNAGKGSVFNARGEHELEASIMDGRTLQAGAVANVRGIKNPVTLARWVMERTPHVYLQGDGAIAFAQAQGMELVAPDYFWTEQSWNALKTIRLGSSAGRSSRPLPGTVGAVALDRHGNLAAATSTGGITGKMPGRVGDSSVIGAGTYANNASCAVSCTGQGEYFIRATVARDICALVEYAGSTARRAARTVLRKRLEPLGGRGGVIVVDRYGDVCSVFTTESMPHGVVTHETPARTALFPTERPSSG
jgi:L-asparaginase / beta-aspartyl-peptidase